jgi:hypothetical protein
MGEADERAPPEFFLWRWTKALAYGLYSAAYVSGGFFADLFGITTPRYDYVLREWREQQRQLAEEEARLADQALENGET